MAQDILYPLENFNFMLRVEGIFDMPCKSVHGFTRDKEYEYIQEGGMNDYVHMKRKPITKPYTFTVERYVATDPWIYDPLQEGTDLLLPVMLFVSRHAGNFGLLQSRRYYTFTGCTVISKEYGELNSERPGLLVEKVTISYRELVTVTLPSDWDSIGKWSIDEPSLNTRAARDRSKDFIRDEEDNITESRVSLWKFDKKDPLGTGKRKAKAYTGTNEANAELASKWDINSPEDNRRAVQDYSVDFEVDEEGNIIEDRVGKWTISPENPQGTGKQNARVYQKPDSEAGAESSLARKWEINTKKNPNAKSVRSALTLELLEGLQNNKK